MSTKKVLNKRVIINYTASQSSNGSEPIIQVSIPKKKSLEKTNGKDEVKIDETKKIPPKLKSKTIPIKEESEDESEDDYVDNAMILYTKPVSVFDLCSDYEISARSLVNTHTNWIPNRDKKQQTVDDFYNTFKSRPSELSGSLFVVVKLLNYNILKIIDGQHRFEAIKKICDEDYGFDKVIKVRLYNVKDDTEAAQIFRKINKNSKLEINEVEHDIITKTPDIFEKEFPAYFRVPKKLRVNAPDINYYQFQESIKNNLKLYPNSFSDSNSLISEIKKENNEFEKILQKDPTIYKSMYEKIKKRQGTKFYLGCRPQLVWLDDIFKKASTK